MWEDTREEATTFGLIYPDTRRIVISEKTSTFLQFRNIDYAMERCVIVVDVPNRLDEYSPETTLDDPTVVDIWHVDVDVRTEISPYTGGASMHNAPRRLDLLVTLTFSLANTSRSQEFRCPSGEFTAVELACSGRGGLPRESSKCFVDFWQDRRARPFKGRF
ncbi:hypothetical protein C8Q78DRAFT_982017 [Trametes maxima]|nr:hypothetical protein C8Q78DRAFT_982017 [Trametes maxima]